MAGREVVADRRNRRNKIDALLLNALRRIGGPVLTEWRAVTHELRRVRTEYMIIGTLFIVGVWIGVRV